MTAQCSAGEARDDFTELAVTLDGRMISVRGPLGTHASRAIGILERVVKREERNALVPRELGDQRGQPPDLRFRLRPAVVPRRQVDDGDAQPELLATPN